MTNAIIFHGTGPHASADKFWYHNVATTLSQADIPTIVPELTNLDREPLSDTIGY